MNSETPTKLKNYSGVRPARIEYIGGELGLLAGETDEESALGVKTCMVGFRALRDETHVKPVQRLICQLRPTVEEAAIAILRIENVFT